MNRSPFRVTVAAALFALAGCSAGEPETPVARGENTYKHVCIVCHAANPSEEGSLGPAIAGSPRELIYARVVHASYPEGYTPKRNTLVMPKMPHLAGAVDDLAAFLNQ